MAQDKAFRDGPWSKAALAIFSGLLIALLAIIPFLPTLKNGFVWDDHDLIENNSALDRPSAALANVIYYGASPTPYYRPLMTIYHGGLRALWGLRPWIFHLFSILLHAGAAVLLLAVARKLLPPLPAVAAAALFAVHPVHVEAVAFASAGPNDLMASIFFLAAFLWLLSSRMKSPDQSWPGGLPTAGAALLIFLALLAKETSAIFPAVIALALWRDLKSGPGGLRRQLIRLWPMAAAIAFYGLWRAYAFWNIRTNPAKVSVSFQPGQYPTLAVEFFRLLFYPRLLAPEYELPPASWPVCVMAFVLAAGFAYGLLRLGRARSWDEPFSFGAGMLVLTFLPALPFVPRMGAPLADRFFYLPSIGLAILAAAALDLLFRRRGKAKNLLAIAGLAAIVAVWGRWSFIAAGYWRNDLSLFSAGVRNDPDNVSLRFLRGETLRKEKRFAEAGLTSPG